MRFNQILTLSLAVYITMGCAATKFERLKEIKRGMDKAQVLEVAGNPSNVSHQSGFDKWAFLNTSKHSDSTIYIFFDAGKVIYSGPNSESPQLGSKSTLKKSTPKTSDFKPIGD
ncbi:MAG: outer membrane protein assembly factor BamE [Bdellovibrionales bacterium]